MESGRIFRLQRVNLNSSLRYTDCCSSSWIKSVRCMELPYGFIIVFTKACQWTLRRNTDNFIEIKLTLDVWLINHHAMKTYWGMKVQLHAFPTPVISGWVVNCTLRPPLRWWKNPSNGRMGDWVDTESKREMPSAGSRTVDCPVVQPAPRWPWRYAQDSGTRSGVDCRLTPCTLLAT